MRSVVLLLLPLLLQAGAAPPPPPDPAIASLLTQLGSGDAMAIARAESALVRLGPRSTGPIAAWLSGPRRDPRAVSAVLRVIARVKDPEAMKSLLTEWAHEDSRDALIDAWAAFGDASVSPLAGYFSSATTAQQEKIIDALGRVGTPAVPALKGMRNQLAGDQSSLAERIGERIDLALLKAPAVSLARKGPVACRDLEAMAADPATPRPVAEEAIRGLTAMSGEGDEAAQALQRLAGRPLTPELHAALDPAADEARLLLLSRRGEASIAEFSAIARDAGARESLRMGAVNALYGMGPVALPAFEKLGAELPAGPLAGYVRDLTVSLRAMPAGARTAPTGTRPAPPVGRTGESPCLPGANFTLVAKIRSPGMPVSPRWFQRSADGGRLAYTTVESGAYRLVVSNPDGSAAVAVAPLAHQFAPAWSTDARRLVFLGSRAPIVEPTEYCDVYTAGAAGEEPRRLTTAPGAYASPVWLPRRDEVMYAANTFASPQGGDAAGAGAILYRQTVTSGQTEAVLVLSGRIITAIEPSPDGRRIAFLSWETGGPGAGTLYLHLTDPNGASPREIGLVPGGDPAAGAGRFDPKEALALGGDLTWSQTGSRLTAAGRIVDVGAWRIESRVDPANDAYAARAASRTLLEADGGCAWYGDTRQIMRRCPGEKLSRPEADCRGALLWRDERRGQLGLFDAQEGLFGLVQLPPPGPVAP